MLQRFKTGYLLLFTLLLSACSTVPVMESDFVAQERAVGVIALVDKHTTRQFVGSNTFNTETDWVHFNDLNLEQTIIDVVKTNLDQAGIAAKAIDASSLPTMSSSSNNDSLQQLARKNGVDFLIFITPTSSSDFIFGSNHVIKGHGIYYQSHPALKTNTVAYYSGRILSYDAKNNIWGGEQTSSAQTSASSHAYLYKTDYTPKHGDVIQSAHHEFTDFESLTAEELAHIKLTLHQITSQAVTRMLSQLPFNKTMAANSLISH